MYDGSNTVNKDSFNWGVFSASVIGFIVAAVLGSCLFATRVFPQEVTDWSGPFVQFQQSVVSGGSNDLSFSNDKYGIDFPIYEMGLKLEEGSSAIGAGYRGEFGDSGLYLGIKGMVHFGSFTGSESWSVLEGEVGTRVDFASDTLYSLGIEVGAELSPKLFGYIGGGIAAADMTICGEAHVLLYTVSECATGFAPGMYASLGASYDLGDNWSVGGEVQIFHFEGRQDISLGEYDIGDVNMDVDEFLINVTLQKRF